jgi:uroporphyrin-III C-methyltransferase
MTPKGRTAHDAPRAPQGGIPVRPPEGAAPKPPCVWLVGAGPGDPELLTIKALRAIRQATVLLVDDLVGEAVLRYARRSARIVRVGKRGGCISTPQAFIDKLMVAEALKGERVVRLKGGDPGIFGRGGEEAQALREAGIAVQWVNGISAGLAAASALQGPLTHREHAHGVMFITGHAGDAQSELHWPSIAAAAAQGLTLVLYMAMQRLPQLCAGLQSALPASTPAALVQSASTAQERRLISSLGAIVAEAQATGMGSPAVLIVGDVLQGCAAMAASASQPTTGAAFTPTVASAAAA